MMEMRGLCKDESDDKDKVGRSRCRLGMRISYPDFELLEDYSSTGNAIFSLLVAERFLADCFPLLPPPPPPPCLRRLW